MVIILSNKTDLSANHLVDWLYHYNIEFVRLSNEDQIDLKFAQNGVLFECKYKSFHVSSIKGIFSRGVLMNFKSYFANKYFTNEHKHLIDFVIHLLSKKKNVFLNNIGFNKLIVSDIARSVSLNVPKQFIVENIKDFSNILSKDIILCTKSICGINQIIYKNTYKSLYTVKLKRDHLKKIKQDEFFPSLVQKYIEKRFEIRSFYINGKTYSMAIFSQSKKNSYEDYRKGYQSENIRTSAFKLPMKIEIKIIKLMKKIGLRSGSIDLIYSKNKEFYFLEVNPVGQFNFLSEECNYNIENKIVEMFKVA